MKLIQVTGKLADQVW